MSAPDLYQMMQNVKLRLANPRAGSPDDFALLQQVCSHVRTVLRTKQNSGNVFNYGDTTVDVFPNESTYQINVPNFGTPLAVLTSDPGNQNVITRLIPFYSPQNLFFNWALPNNFASWLIPYDGSNCTAARCSFTWRDNIPYVEFLPMPMLSAQYQVRFLYGGNGVDDMALTQSPLMEEDCDVVEIRAARSLLSHAEWQAPDSPERVAYNSMKKKELMDTLVYDEALAQRQFDAAQLLSTGPRIHSRFDMTAI